MGQSKAQETISCLTKEAIRQGKNKREGEGSEGQGSGAGYSGGYSTGIQTGGSYGQGPTQQSKMNDLAQRLFWTEPSLAGYSGGGYQQSESRYGGGKSLPKSVQCLS